MRLTWSKQPHETGLRAVGQSPRGLLLKVDGEIVGRVCANCVGWMKWAGWYWCARSDEKGVPLYNTAALPPGNDEAVFKDIEGAKSACEAYVRECLKLPPKKGSKS